jgi:predicted transcriptional regulator
MTPNALLPFALWRSRSTRRSRKARVKRLVEARRRAPHWLMREAISQHIEREEKSESFRQDDIKAWNEHHATGRQ